MQTRTIGSLTVSLAGLGTNNFGRRCDAGASAAVVAAALDAGVTFFDTADIYGSGLSEEYLGRALGSRRDEAVIATKFGHEAGHDQSRPPRASAAWIRTACEASLRRLGTDRIDLYQLHMPDDSVPIEETLGALDELVQAGKVLEIGNSNFSGAQIDHAEQVAATRGTARFASAQNVWSLLRREIEQDILPACERNGLTVIPYFPLASGLLTGKYQRGSEPPQGTRLHDVPAERREALLSDRNFDIVDRLTAFANARGHTLLELAMGWLASQPQVASVIAGATTVEQIRANAAAVSWKLSPEEMAEVNAITA